MCVCVCQLSSPTDFNTHRQPKETPRRYASIRRTKNKKKKKKREKERTQQGKKKKKRLTK